MAYELIETIEVGAGGAASIEFTSIPQDGVDLLLVFSGRDTSTTENAKITLNNDAGSNYPTVTLDGNGSTASSSAVTGTRLRGLQGQSSYTSNTFGSVSIYISNYTSTTNKSISADEVNENNATTAYQRLAAYSYSTSSAITSIQIASFTANLAQYTTASVYKIY